LHVQAFIAPFTRIVNRAPSGAKTSTTASLPAGASLKAANGVGPLSSMKSGRLTDAARALVRNRQPDGVLADAPIF
jgi:hypothetical protein